MILLQIILIHEIKGKLRKAIVQNAFFTKYKEAYSDPCLDSHR